jgi:hypothetical protein
MSGLFPSKQPTGVWYRDHSLSLVIIAILVSQTVFTLWAGHTVWLEDSLDHGAKLTELDGYTDMSFLRWWSYEYQQSLVADTYGVLLIVLLSKWLHEVGSAESTDE